MDYREVARRTGLSVGAIERQVALALLDLHRALEQRPPTPRWRRLLARIAAKIP